MIVLVSRSGRCRVATANGVEINFANEQFCRMIQRLIAALAEPTVQLGGWLSDEPGDILIVDV